MPYFSLYFGRVASVFIWQGRMTKREYIVELLWRLRPYWPMADGLLQLLSSQDIDNKAIDGLITIFQHVFDESIESAQKKKFWDSLTALKKIQALEQQERESEQKELEEVEQLIADI